MGGNLETSVLDTIVNCSLRLMAIVKVFVFFLNEGTTDVSLLFLDDIRDLANVYSNCFYV